MKLSSLAYYRTGGTCEALHEPKSIEELSGIVQTLASQGIPYFVLGGGTNSLVWDEHFPGAVIVFTQMKALRVDGTSLYVQAGVENSALAAAALQNGLEGASWMHRLPGQLGATVRMNARCYGGEISEIVSEVKAVLPDGTIVTYTQDDGIFKGYKDTLFMDNGAIVAEARIDLKPGVRETIAAHMDFCEKDRIAKGQFLHPTCGCVFKNDYSVGVPSGMLLDRAKAHDLNSTTVALNPKHANFVYNRGADSRSILAFTFEMQELVYQTYGVWMEFEMEILGRLPSDLQHRFREKRDGQWKIEALEPLRSVFSKAKKIVPAE